jgi:hypothetical protein
MLASKAHDIRSASGPPVGTRTKKRKKKKGKRRKDEEDQEGNFTLFTGRTLSLFREGKKEMDFRMVLNVQAEWASRGNPSLVMRPSELSAGETFSAL